MAQEKITFNSVEIKQPEKGLGYSFETTYTDDSTRVQSGVLHTTPLFTVESFSYSAKWLTIAEMKTILQIVAKGRYFKMHYFLRITENGGTTRFMWAKAPCLLALCSRIRKGMKAFPLILWG